MIDMVRVRHKVVTSVHSEGFAFDIERLENEGWTLMPETVQIQAGRVFICVMKREMGESCKVEVR